MDTSALDRTAAARLREADAKRLDVEILPYRVVIEMRKPHDVVKADVQRALERDFEPATRTRYVVLHSFEVENPEEAFYRAAWGGGSLNYYPLTIVRVWYYKVELQKK